MTNRQLPMAYRLWQNEARRLLRKALIVYRFNSEGDMLLDEQNKKDCGHKCNYWPGSDEGKMLNEIDAFLNKKASLFDENI